MCRAWEIHIVVPWWCNDCTSSISNARQQWHTTAVHVQLSRGGSVHWAWSCCITHSPERAGIRGFTPRLRSSFNLDTHMPRFTITLLCKLGNSSQDTSSNATRIKFPCSLASSKSIMYQLTAREGRSRWAFLFQCRAPSRHETDPVTVHFLIMNHIMAWMRELKQQSGWLTGSLALLCHSTKMLAPVRAESFCSATMRVPEDSVGKQKFGEQIRSRRGRWATFYARRTHTGRRVTP